MRDGNHGQSWVKPAAAFQRHCKYRKQSAATLQHRLQARCKLSQHRTAQQGTPVPSKAVVAWCQTASHAATGPWRRCVNAHGHQWMPFMISCAPKFLQSIKLHDFSTVQLSSVSWRCSSTSPQLKSARLDEFYSSHKIQQLPSTITPMAGRCMRPHHFLTGRVDVKDVSTSTFGVVRALTILISYGKHRNNRTKSRNSLAGA